MWWASSHTLVPTWILGAGSCFSSVAFSFISWLVLIFSRRCPWTCCIVVCTRLASILLQSWLPHLVSSKDILGISSCNGEELKPPIVCNELLCSGNSASGSHFTLESCCSLVNTPRYRSMPPFTFPVCTSPWGCKAVHNGRLKPNLWHNWYEKMDDNWYLLSEIIMFRSLCSLTTSVRNSSASPQVSTIVWHGTKCHILDCWSTLPQTALNHSQSGNPIMKSIHKSNHGSSRIGRGRCAPNMPSILGCVHQDSAHCCHYHSTCFEIVLQLTGQLNKSNILARHAWPASAVWLGSNIDDTFNAWSTGTYILRR